MYSRSFLLLISLLFSLGSVAQTNIIGKIIDVDTKQGIPYASIIYLSDPSQQGGYSDSIGNFNILKKELDLQVSCIGYKTLKIESKFVEQGLLISLRPEVISLQPVEIQQVKIKTMQLGYFKNKTFKSPLSPGVSADRKRQYRNFVAQYVPNAKEDTTIKITKLLYNLSNHPDSRYTSGEFHGGGCVPTKLRVHLFTVNSYSKLPDQELLTKNQIIINDCSSDNLIVDISDENVYLPKNGVFVALEYVDVNRTKSATVFPYYVICSTPIATRYESFHQEKWALYWWYKENAKWNARFGLEVIK